MTTVKTTNVAHLGVMFDEVGSYDLVVDGVACRQAVRLVGGHAEDDSEAYSWEASDDNGVHERGEWVGLLSDAIDAAKSHVEDNDGRYDHHYQG